MVVRPIHFDAALRPSSTGFGLSSQIQFQSLSSPCLLPPTLHFPGTKKSLIIFQTHWALVLQEPAWNSTLPETSELEQLSSLQNKH